MCLQMVINLNLKYSKIWCRAYYWYIDCNKSWLHFTCHCFQWDK